MNLRTLVFVILALGANHVRAEETPQDGNNPDGFAFIENATDGEDQFLVGQTLSGGWMSEAMYEDGLIANAPGEGAVWVEYEANFKGGWFAKTFLAISDESPGHDSYANENDIVIGFRKDVGDGNWTTSIEGSILYYNFAAPSLAGTSGDVWGLNLEVEWSSEESALKPYFTIADYFGIDDPSASGVVGRAGVRGEWGEEVGWAIDVAVGHNFGWFNTTGTYVYTYAGPWFTIGKNLTISIPEVTVIEFLDGNGDNLAAVGFTFTKTWGGEE